MSIPFVRHRLQETDESDETTRTHDTMAETRRPSFDRITGPLWAIELLQPLYHADRNRLHFRKSGESNYRVGDTMAMFRHRLARLLSS